MTGLELGIRNDSKVAYALYIMRGLFGVGGFPFLLSLLVLLCSKATDNFEQLRLLSCFVSSIRTSCSWPCSQYHIIVTNITYA